MKFNHDDDAERDMGEFVPERFGPLAKYGDVSLIEPSSVRAAHRTYSAQSHYRTTLVEDRPDLKATLDSRIFVLGATPEDLRCEHKPVHLDRFGFARCDTCECHLWSAWWVAAGLYDGIDGETVGETLAYAEHTAKRYEDLMPKLALVRGWND